MRSPSEEAMLKELRLLRAAHRQLKTDKTKVIVGLRNKIEDLENGGVRVSDRDKTKLEKLKNAHKQLRHQSRKKIEHLKSLTVTEATMSPEDFAGFVQNVMQLLEDISRTGENALLSIDTVREVVTLDVDDGGQG